MLYPETLEHRPTLVAFSLSLTRALMNGNVNHGVYQCYFHVLHFDQRLSTRGDWVLINLISLQMQSLWDLGFLVLGKPASLPRSWKVRTLYCSTMCL